MLTIDTAQSAARSRAETDALIIEQIAKQLDAALASYPWTRQHIAFLPDVEHWPVIDHTVRLWASANKLRTVHVNHGNKLVVDRYQFTDGTTFVTVHLPTEMLEQEVV